MKDDDFGSSDEIKIFKDEGDDDDKDFSAHEELQAALLEEKSSLILETEMAIKQECLARIEPGKTKKSSLPSKLSKAKKATIFLPPHLFLSRENLTKKRNLSLRDQLLFCTKIYYSFSNKDLLISSRYF